MNLGNAIMTLRKEKKISRVKLAERSNLSITALYNIENNLSFPTKETIDKICTSLEVPVSFLMFTDGAAASTAHASILFAANHHTGISGAGSKVSL